jgi:hypothetical protein
MGLYKTEFIKDKGKGQGEDNLLGQHPQYCAQYGTCIEKETPLIFITFPKSALDIQSQRQQIKQCGQ